MTITGSSLQQLTVIIVPSSGFVIEKGGLLIIEYSNLDAGTCSNTLHTNTTWDGILVKGDSSERHYDWIDETNGWNPYAQPFVPGGLYKTNSNGELAHGRLQIRWCTLRGIQENTAQTAANNDDSGTPYINEMAFGNYAIRSTEGGILNIIDCEFKYVKTGVLIDNY